MSGRRIGVSLLCLVGPLLISAALAQIHSNVQFGKLPGMSSAFPNADDNGVGGGEVTGTVHTMDGHAVSGASVLAHDTGRGNAFVTVYSDANGSFAFHNLPPGSYEITAGSGGDRTTEHIEIGRIGDTTVNLRLPSKPAAAQPADGNRSTVSFAEYRVPAKARSLFQKAAELLSHGKTDQALEKANEALAVFPRFAEAFTLRGIIRERAGEVEAAIADYQRAIDSDKNFSLAYISMASAFNSMGRFTDAVPLLGQVDRIAPDLWQTSYELARSNLGRNDFEGAIRCTDRAAQLHGSSDEPPELHLVRGYALLGLSKIEKAREEIQAFLAREPKGRIADSARTVLSSLGDTTVAASH